jgi:hypothetical protein
MKAEVPTITEIADALDTLASARVGDRIQELAGYDASFWRDAALVLRQVDEKSLEKTDRRLPSADLKSIFEKCHFALGGESNPDIQWYLCKRPDEVSRNCFFENATWAIWVAGMKRKGAETFLARARDRGFCWDFATVNSWDDKRLLQFAKELHGQPVPDRARKKWETIHNIAGQLGSYPTEEDFSRAFFAGKTESKDLDETDALRLLDRDIPFIGEASARFIIRNMGGELIKYDRWIRAFLEYFGISPHELETQLQELGIQLGLFDIVIWAYCEENVRKVDRFAQHFEQHFTTG